MRRRLLLLGHPLVIGSLALLAVNDHVLKPWSGSVDGPVGLVARAVTGKLSDGAGVALVALLLGLLTGRRRGAVALVGVGFAALKVVPGGAELVAPLLGGTTRRDVTDLVALAVLVPVGLWLRRADRTAADVEGGAGSTPHWSVRVGGAVAAALPIAVAGTSVVAVTATSCDFPPAVIGVEEVDGRVYAQIPDGPGWAASDDEGRTWEAAEDPPVTTVAPSTSPTSAIVPTAPSCDADGTCYRTDGESVLQRRDGDGPWIDDLRFTAAEERRLDDARQCGGERRFEDALALDGLVIVAMGEEGVMRRAEGGDWERIGVLGIDPTPLPGWPGGDAADDGDDPTRALLLAPLALLLGAVGLAGAALRRRTPLVALALLGLGVVGAVVATGVWLAGSVVGGGRWVGPVVVGASLAMLVLSVVVTRWGGTGSDGPPGPPSAGGPPAGTRGVDPQSSPWG